MKICITRCEKCHLERTAFRSVEDTACPRCDFRVQIARWIETEDANLIAQSRRENEEYIADLRQQFAAGTTVVFDYDGHKRTGRVEHLDGNWASIRMDGGMGITNRKLKELAPAE